MTDEQSRRGFLKGSTGAVLAAAPLFVPASAFGANDKVSIGWIGSGTRGYYCMERMYAASKENIAVNMVCDTFEGNLAKGKDRVQTIGGNTPKTTNDYREVLADKSIDVVFIMTPEHLHYSMLKAALQAGKNAYVEKPLAHTIEEGAELVKMAEKSGKIVQVGTQNRSNSLYIKAKEMVAQGMIGDCHYTKAFWYRNSLNDNPAWRYAIPAEANEQNTDFSKFLGPAPKKNFDKQRYYQWRLYWDYSNGIATDLMVHQTDITNFVLGKSVPSSVVASGGIYRWTQDDREVPDTFSAVFEYPEKFHLNYSSYFGNEQYGYGEQFMGNEGTIEVTNRSELKFYSEKFRGKAPANIAARKDESISMPGNDNKAVEAHIKNLIDAVRGQGQVIAPPRVGQEAALGGHLATIALRKGKKVLWDAKTEKYSLA